MAKREGSWELNMERELSEDGETFIRWEEMKRLSGQQKQQTSTQYWFDVGPDP